VPIVNPVKDEIKYFIRDKLLEEKVNPEVALKFVEKVDKDIDKAVEELWFEEITPGAEEKAEEIIERNRDKLKKLKEVV